MGSALSCCPCFPGGQDDGQETQPLLDQNHPDEHIIPPQDTFNRLAEILAALLAGKIPTQEQLNDAIRVVLNSNLMKDARRQTGTSSEYLAGHEKLSHWSAVVLEDVCEVLQALMELGVEKNHDDLIQDLVYQAQQVSSDPVHLDRARAKAMKDDISKAASKQGNGQLPSREEFKSDTGAILRSLMDVVALGFTSTSFRILLTDVLMTVRELLADTAAQIAESGDVVASGAKTVENIIRPSDEEKQNMSSPKEAVSRPAQELAQEANNQTEKVEQAEATLRKAAEESVKNTKEAWAKLREESPDRVREAIIQRISVVLQEIFQHPQYRRSIETMINVFRKYGGYTFKTAALVLDAAEASTSAAAENVAKTSPSEAVEVDPHLSEALSDFATLVERFAAGRKLDTVVETTGKAVTDLNGLVENPESGPNSESVSGVLKKAQDYCDHVGSNPDWASSAEAKDQLGDVYDSIRRVVSGETPEEKELKSDLVRALEQVQWIIDGFSQDRATTKLLSAFTNLATHLSYLASVFRYDTAPDLQRQSRATAKQVKRQIKSDILSYVLPRLLRALKVVPLPRVEYKSADMDIVLDNLNLESLSFVPDHIAVYNSNEMHVLGSDATVLPSSTPGVVSTQTRTKVKIEGLRVSARDIAYFVDYRTPGWSVWGVGWSDSGRLTVDVGGWRSVGQGLQIEVEVEVDAVESPSSSTNDNSTRRGRSESVVTGTTLLDHPIPTTTRLKVISVKVDAPGLKVSIAKSKHWIFNSLCLQPLLGPTIREVLQTVVSQKIKAALESLSNRVEVASATAEKEQDDHVVDFMSPSFWRALIFGSPDQARSQSRSPSPPPSPKKDTSTSVTFKGVVQRSTVKSTGEETLLAVGIGEQIMPEVQLPSPTAENPHARNLNEAGEILVEEGREALDELQEGAETIAGAVKADVNDAVTTAHDARERVREELGVAQERMHEVEERERKRKGWKSDVFDLSK